MTKPGPKPKPTLSMAIEQYMAAREGQERSTLAKHRGTLDRFAQSVQGNRESILMDTIDIGHVTAWRLERLNQRDGNGKGLAMNTLNMDRMVIVLFFEWCYNHKLYKGVPPTDHLKKVKGWEHQFLRLPAERWSELLDSAPNPRDRFALAVGLYSFARASEIRSMKISDLSPFPDGAPGLRITRWKTKKNDHLEIVEEFQEEIDRYLVWYRATLAAQGLELLPGHQLVPRFVQGTHQPVRGFNGRFLSQQRIDPTRPHMRMEQFVKAALTEMGYPVEREGMHMLRRSGALAYFVNLSARVAAGEVLPDTPIRIVMHLLGHQEQRTTEIYLGVTQGVTARNQVMRGRRMIEDIRPKAPVVELTSSVHGPDEWPDDEITREHFRARARRAGLSVVRNVG